MTRYYPIYLNLSDRLAVVVGGGAVAERKVLGLREAGARVRVVSPALTPTLQALADAGEIEATIARYETAHLAEAFLVFAATNDRAVNAQVVADANDRHLLVNVADAPDEGQFLVPSVVRRGELCLAISTGGNTPALAGRLARELEARFGPDYAEYVELLGQMRDYIKVNVAAPARRAAHQRLLESEEELRTLLRYGEKTVAIARAEAIIDAFDRPLR